MSTNAEYMSEFINDNLARATIRNAVLSEDKESFGFEIVRKAKGRGNYTVHTIWVDCDAEGNGPGWLSTDDPEEFA